MTAPVQILANARRRAVDAACNFARFVANESRTRLTPPPPPPAICGSVVTAAVRLFLLALLALAGAAAVGDDAFAHSDRCPEGQHATLLNNFCVDAAILGFADWCEAKSRASGGHYWEGNYASGSSIECAVGTNPSASWCDPFEADGYFTSQDGGAGAGGGVVGAVGGLFCSNNMARDEYDTPPKLYSDGTCPLPADDPESYDPDAHGCNLIHPGINVLATNSVGNTPLHLAAAQGNLAAVENFLAAGAVVNTLNAAGRTPLGEAAVNNRGAAAVRLIAEGGHYGAACAPLEVNPNSNSPPCLAPPAGEATIFISAATGGTVSAEWSGDANLQDGETVPVRTLVTFTARAGRGGRLREWGGACAGGAVASPECVWSAFASATVSAAFECAAANLPDAARFGNSDGTACLLEHGADANAGGGSHNRTPLHWAVIAVSPEAVRLLLAAPGIDANKKAGNGGSPMVESGFKGSAEIAGLLANFPGISLNAVNGDENTALHLAAALGHLAVVNTLLAANAIVNTLNAAGRTALGEAVTNNRAAAAGRLIEAGGHHGTACGPGEKANPNSATPPCVVPPTTPQRVFVSAATGGTVSAGWSGDANLQSGDSVPPGATVTFTAAAGAGGRLSQWGGACAGLPVDPPECVWNILAEVTVSAAFACTGSFLNAARFGDIPVASCQLEHGADVNAGVGNHSRTPLHWAVINVRPAMVRFLLATPGIDANKKAGNGGSPMVESGFKGSAEVAGLLANHPGIILDATNNDGNTALHLAAAGGHLAVVNTLLAANAIVNTLNAAGLTPLGEAVANGRNAAARRLIAAGGRHGPAALYEHYFPAANRVEKCQGVSSDNDRAVDVRDPGAADPAANVAYVCRNGAESEDVCYLRKDGGTGLAGLRTAGGHTFVGADPAPPCTEAHPPCYDSDASGALDDGQNPFADNCIGAPPLVSIFISDSPGGTVSAEWAEDSNLQSGGAVPPGATVTFTATPGDGYELTRWTDACAEDTDSDSQCAFAATVNATVGADFDCLDFHLSAGILENLAGVKCNLDAGADVNARDGAGATPLYWAAGEMTVILQLLLDNNASVNVQNAAGHTPLHNAVDAGRAENVILLISAGASLNARDASGETPLYEAATSGKSNRARIMEILVGHGADPDLADNAGWTPLHYSIDRFHDTVPILLSLGASPNSENSDGERPLDTAIQFAPRFVPLLIENGAHHGTECAPPAEVNPSSDSPPCLDGIFVSLSLSAGGTVSVSWAEDSDVQDGEGFPPGGATVTFTALPDDGYELTLWTGACAGDSVSDARCVLAVTMDATVGAEFGCLNGAGADGVCECDSGHRRINEICVHETESLPENEATCANVFGGDWVDLSAEHGDGKGVCSGIDINDTFCLTGTVSALPCLGLFNHVRSCNFLGRPALDPWHCGAACDEDEWASGARCVPRPGDS